MSGFGVLADAPIMPFSVDTKPLDFPFPGHHFVCRMRTVDASV